MNFYLELKEELKKIGVNVLQPTSDLMINKNDLKQFNITAMNNSPFDHFYIEELTLLIKSHSTKIVFLPLPIVKSAKFCKIDCIEHIHARYIEDCGMHNDIINRRWDVLVY